MNIRGHHGNDLHSAESPQTSSHVFLWVHFSALALVPPLLQVLMHVKQRHGSHSTNTCWEYFCLPAKAALPRWWQKPKSLKWTLGNSAGFALFPVLHVRWVFITLLQYYSKSAWFKCIWNAPFMVQGFPDALEGVALGRGESPLGQGRAGSLRSELRDWDGDGAAKVRL